MKDVFRAVALGITFIICSIFVLVGAVSVIFGIMPF